MNNRIKACFTEQVVSKYTKCHKLFLSDLTLLGNWQSFVYRYGSKAKHGIMGITHYSHRSFQQIQDEIDFILYLHDNS